MKIEYVAPVADITYFNLAVLTDNELSNGGGIQTPEDSWL